MTDKIKKGNSGEELAAEFLARKGFEVVRRNYRYGRSEIDLIVKRNDWLLFVEVKTRSSSDFGEPETFVTREKANNIFRAAEHFIFTTNWQGHVRFDVVSVKLGDKQEVVHFEDAIN